LTERIGCVLDGLLRKTESEAAVMDQIKKYMPQEPPTVATDGLEVYREALLATWGIVPE